MRTLIVPTLHATLKINGNYVYEAHSTVNLVIFQYYNMFLFLTLIHLCGTAERSE